MADKEAARNVLNPGIVDAFVERLALQTVREPVRAWLRSTYRKHILKTHPAFDRVIRHKGAVLQVDSHHRTYPLTTPPPIWLDGALTRGDVVVFLHAVEQVHLVEGQRLIGWLNSADVLDIVGRLNRVGVPDAIAAAQAWEARCIAEELAKEAKRGVQTLYVFPDGHRVVKLTSQEAVRHEGHQMRHCVADCHTHQIDHPFEALLSLRDADDQPRVTMERIVQGGRQRLFQIRGFANAAPRPEDAARIRRFILESGLDVGADGDMVGIHRVGGELVFGLEDVLFRLERHIRNRREARRGPVFLTWEEADDLSDALDRAERRETLALADRLIDLLAPNGAEAVRLPVKERLDVFGAPVKVRMVEAPIGLAKLIENGSLPRKARARARQLVETAAWATIQAAQTADDTIFVLDQGRNESCPNWIERIARIDTRRVRRTRINRLRQRLWVARRSRKAEFRDPAFPAGIKDTWQAGWDRATSLIGAHATL